MAMPGVLKRFVGIGALTQREPDPVADGVERRGLTDPDIGLGGTADAIDAAGALALLVGGDGPLAVDPCHDGSLFLDLVRGSGHGR